MKTFAVSLFLLGASLVCGNTDIPITSVVVFSGRAQVTRSATIALRAGDNAIALEGLPWDLEEGSTRVAMDRPGAALRRVEVEPVFSRLVREEEAATLKEQVGAIKAAIHDLSKRSDTLRGQIKFLGTFEVAGKPHAADQAPPTVAINPKSWMGVLDFVSEGLRTAFAQLDAINREGEERSKELEVLSTRLERLSSKDVKRYKNVYVHLAAEKDLSTAVSVSYMVPGPQWFPRYEARADVPGGKVKLNAYALVRQETGEDWKGARLTVSTVDLSVSASLPALVTDRISPVGIMHIEPAIRLAAQPRAPPAPETVSRPSADAPALGKSFVRAAEADLERRSLSSLQSELTQQRVNLSLVKKLARSAKAPVPVQPAAELQAVGAGIADGTEQTPAGGRIGKLRDMYQMQGAAFQARDYDKFSGVNNDIVQLYNTLSGNEQKALVEFADEARDNVAKAQRLMKSEKLGKDLVSPQTSAAGVDYRFQSIGPANVYSEWVLTKVPYLEVEVPVTYAYESAPVLSQLFYLIGTGSNPLDRPLLAGPMAVFIGPDFVGESVLEKRPSGSGMRFELGLDREVEIRRQIERRRDTAGFLLRRHHYVYDITIYAVNRKPSPIEAIVVDRMPYCPKEETSVDVRELSANPEPDNRWDGLYRWRMKIPPGEKREIRFRYEMSHRSKLALVANEGGGPW